MKKMILGACVLLLGMSAGCGPDEKTASQTRNLGSGCTLLRPVTWTVLGTTCVEDQNATNTQMYDGEYYQIFADVFVSSIFGDGSVTYQCSNGAIIQTSASCHKVIGSIF
ncbi:MAG TPA: hypothetical protein VI356_16210 [Myxococcales bacterium]